MPDWLQIITILALIGLSCYAKAVTKELDKAKEYIAALKKANEFFYKEILRLRGR